LFESDKDEILRFVQLRLNQHEAISWQ